MRVLICTLALLLIGSIYPPDALCTEETRVSIAARNLPNGRPEAQSDQTIHVPGDYPTIQQAINAASYGDRVVVAEGSYYESITMRSGVDLIGEGADLCVIRSSGTVVNAASECRLSGFRLIGHNYGVRCIGVQDFQVLDNVIAPLTESGSRYSVVGIYLKSCTDIVVRDNTIGNLHEELWGYAAGISIETSSDVTVIRNSVYNIIEEEWDGCYGIRLRSGTHVSLFNNVVYHVIENEWDDAFGIFCGGQSNTVLNNVVKYTYGNDWGSAVGIQCMGSHHKVSNNIVEEVYESEVGTTPEVTYGIVDSGTENEISYNDVWRVLRPYAEDDSNDVGQRLAAGHDNRWQTHFLYHGEIEPVLGPGNLNVDPMFAGWPAPRLPDYYVLEANSPCSDAGDPAPEYNDSDGTRNDMGIYGGPHAYVPRRHPEVAVFQSSTRARRGADMEYLVMVTNAGELEAHDVSLAERLPAEVTYVSSDPPGRYVHRSHSVVWYLGHLAGETQDNFTISVAVDGSVGDGTRLASEARIYATAPKDDPENNKCVHTVTIGNERYPNEKMVSPQGLISDERLLTYVIRFDAVRASEAGTVRIQDVLDANLNDGPVLLISSQGGYTSESRTITWELDGAEDLSRGFVSFLAVARAGLEAGVEIRNHASIEFGAGLGVDTPEVISVVGTERELRIQNLINALYLLRREILLTDISNQKGFIAKVDAATRKVLAAADYERDNRASQVLKALGAAESDIEALTRMIQSQAGKKVPPIAALNWQVMAKAILELMRSLNPSKPAFVPGLSNASRLADTADALLHAPCPNPFNPTTTIRYDTARPGHVSVRIYDVNGALVTVLEDGQLPAGRHQVTWNGRNGRGHEVSSGVYFCRLSTAGFEQTRKMLLIK